MPAISFTLGALALFCCGRWLNSRFFGAAAVFGALALLFGPDLIAGLVALGLTLLAGLAFGLSRTLTSLQGEKQPNTWGQVNWLIGGLTLGLVGTGFLLLPQGSAGFARSLPEYLASWVTPSGIPAARLLAAVLFYQPIALFLGFVGGLRGWLSAAEDSDELVPVVSRLLSIWAVLALILPMLQTGRQMSTMAWGMIPLWSLAAIELAHQGLSENNRSRLKVALTGALVIGVFLLMGIYYGLYMSSLAVNNMQELLLISGIGLMAVIVVILIGIGWDFEIARCSSVWSVTAILFVYMLASTWGMGIRQPNNPAELWSSGSAIGQSQELLETLHLLSAYKTGQKTSLEILSINPAPSLRWALRSFINATSQGALSQNQLPAAIITDSNEKSPALLAIYRGQDFDWQVSPGWVTTLPPDLRRWIYNHKAPTVSVRITLWIRGDVFPGGTLNQPAAPAANP